MLMKHTTLLFNKMFLYSWIFILISGIEADLHYLTQGDLIEYKPPSARRGKDSLEIYCYEGKPKYIIHIWQSVSIQIDLKSDNYVYYEGISPESVRKEYLEHRSSWSINLFSWKQKYFKLDPFNQSCIGIESKEPYRIFLNVIRVDYWKVLCLAAGILLFLSASRLSKNSIFYYLCGVSFGICASFLILIYFLSKMFPKKPMMFGFAVCGWTVGVYILQLLWENLRTIIADYQAYVVWYAVIMGLISFLVCYRWGPVTNQRTRDIIRWTLQAGGLGAILCSSHFQEAAMGQVVMLLLLYNFPRRWLLKSKTYWKRKFPPQVSLLSNDDYYQQGVRETEKALDNLRKYCSSPDCKQWKTVLKLQDVKRFASFVEGSPHLSDGEMLEYDSVLQTSELTDDEEEDLLTDEDS